MKSIFRYISIGAPFAKNVSSFENDEVYLTMKGQMLKLISNIKYKLYILDAVPRIVGGAIFRIASSLKNGTDPVILDVRLYRFEFSERRSVLVFSLA